METGPAIWSGSIMINLIEGLPPDVLGIEAAGTAMHGDYREVMIPAVVTDRGWVRGAITMLRPLFADQIRLFELAELAAAKDWISAWSK